MHLGGCEGGESDGWSLGSPAEERAYERVICWLEYSCN